MSDNVRLALEADAATDFPIALDDQSSRFAQTHPVCLPGSGDGGLVLFLDDRNGPSGLWGVAVDATGTPQGANVLIRNAAGLWGLGVPAAARRTSMTILLAYPDGDSAGVFVVPIGNDFVSPSLPQRISAAGVLADRPDLAATSTGTIVVWEDYRSGSQIYARLTDGNGRHAGPEFRVNADPSSASRWVPKAAVGDGDTILIVWEDYRTGEPDIYYRIFTGSGVPVTGDLVATASGTASPQYQPDGVFGHGFGFLLTWIDLRGGAPTVFGRMINPNGVPVGAEFILAHPSDTAVFWEPALAGDGNTQAVVTYESVANHTVICGQRFYLDTAFGNAFSVSDVAAGRDRFHPSVCYRHDGGMVFAWTDYRAENLDLRARTFTINAAPQGADRQLNDDAVGNQQQVGGGATTHSSIVYAVYADQRRDDGDIYVQRISTSGQLVGPPVLVNDDATPARQAEPAIAAAGDGTLLAVWTDARSAHTVGEYDIYFQALPNGAKAGYTNLRLSDDLDSSVQIQPDVAVFFGGGGAIAAWTDYRLGDTAAIFGQVIDESFGREGPNFQIGANFPRPDDTPPKVAAFNVEHAAVAWRADAGGQGTIWIQWISRAVGPLEDPFALPIDSPLYNPGDFDLVRTADDGFGVCWQGIAADRSAIFWQRFNKFFDRVGPNLVISDGGRVLPGRASVDADFAGYLVFAWTETIAGKPTVVRRIVDPYGAPIGPVEVVSDDAGNSFSFAPVAVATGKYAAVLFNDNRVPGRGFDARIGLLLYSATAIVEEEDGNVPEHAMLLQNYPNPFNPATVIAFHVPSAGEYELAVYDILGRRVRTLWNGYRSAGPGSITWDGTTDDGRIVPSGVYFYRLRGASFESTRKMTLLK